MNFDLKKQQLRFLVLYDFKCGVQAIDSHRRVCLAFGDGIVHQATVYDWYRRFQSGDESLEDKPRSGRPSGVNAMEIKESVEQNSHQSVREIASHLEISKSSIHRHLHALGKVPKLGKWVPPSLSEYDKKRRVQAALSLLSVSRRPNWLSTILTSDEKWICYENVHRKFQWVNSDEVPQPIARPGLHPRKIMLCIWLGFLRYCLLRAHVKQYYCYG